MPESKNTPAIQEAVKLQSDTINTVEIQTKQESSAATEQEMSPTFMVKIIWGLKRP